MNIFCWDFDGTLVLSNSLWSRSLLTALNETVSDHGIKFEDIRAELKTGFTWHTPYEDYSKLIGDKWWEHMNRYFKEVFIKLGLSSAISDDAVSKIREIIKRKENYVLYDDTFETLELLKNKGKHIILSNNYPDMEEVVKELGLLSYFDHVVVSSLAGYDKPRKELFDYAKKLYDAEDNFIMIGDNPVADIHGGNQSEMTTILVHRGEHTEADYCFDNLLQITDLFR